MTIALVQSNVVATSTNSPTSITPTFGSSTTSGNFLVLAVITGGTSETITTPASWTLAQSEGSNATCSLFVYPNNPGSITAVAVTITATNGGAVAVVFEFSGMPTLPVDDGGPFTSAANSTALPNIFTQAAKFGDLEIFMLGFLNAAQSVVTGSFSSEWSTAFTARATNGATYNPSLACYWGQSPAMGQTSITGSISPSTFYQAIGLRRTSLISQTLTYTNVGGQAGIYVPQFYQGSIGG